MEIQKSESISEISAALCIAQSEIKGALKDSENPHLKSKYADLASVWEACREPLTRNGLAVVQLPSADGQKVTVTTLLTHKSGEFFASELTITAQQATPQSIGSAITYARRYSLASVAGVSPEDDDAESAEGRGKSRGTKEAAAAVAQEKIVAMKAEPAPENYFKEVLGAFKELKEECEKQGFINVYYEVLAAHGYEHANEIRGGKEKAKAIYREIGSRLSKQKGAQQ